MASTQQRVMRNREPLQPLPDWALIHFDVDGRTIVRKTESLNWTVRGEKCVIRKDGVEFHGNVLQMKGTLKELNEWDSNREDTVENDEGSSGSSSSDEEEKKKNTRKIGKRGKKPVKRPAKKAKPPKTKEEKLAEKKSRKSRVEKVREAEGNREHVKTQEPERTVVNGTKMKLVNSFLFEEVNLKKNSPKPDKEVAAVSKACQKQPPPSSGASTSSNPPPVTATNPATNPAPLVATNPAPITSLNPPLVAATSPPLVSTTSPPLVSTTSPPLVSTTSPPLVSTTSPPLVAVTSLNPPLVAATNSPPVAVTSTNPSLVTSTNPSLVTSTNPSLVTSTNPSPITSTNPSPVTSTNPSPVTYTSPLVTSTSSLVTSTSSLVTITTSANPSLNPQATLTNLTAIRKPLSRATSSTISTLTSTPSSHRSKFPSHHSSSHSINLSPGAVLQSFKNPLSPIGLTPLQNVPSFDLSNEYPNNCNLREEIRRLRGEVESLTTVVKRQSQDISAILQILKSQQALPDLGNCQQSLVDLEDNNLIFNNLDSTYLDEVLQINGISTNRNNNNQAINRFAKSSIHPQDNTQATNRFAQSSIHPQDNTQATNRFAQSSIHTQDNTPRLVRNRSEELKSTEVERIALRGLALMKTEFHAYELKTGNIGGGYGLLKLNEARVRIVFAQLKEEFNLEPGFDFNKGHVASKLGEKMRQYRKHIKLPPASNP
ncbi:serine-rich adhesin for platelets-like [Clytia hemisphaerica]|uniref:serine-rich adhesin for platelets-like n=1 Tax=Clytia hemisphaerica TaxID=252671 RepID=UPI0034D57B21